MPSTRNILAAFAATILSGAHAHMMMGTPVPYGKSTLNNSPLLADGSDFPCKQRSGVYAAEGASNTMPIGVNQTLSFIGSATHGGGSCQISLTTDKAPTASSQWQVIYSIIGGCPTGAAGNIGGDPNGSGASKFEFSIPEGIAPGEYTLAWTWFNKIGNREMYMNCAPVTVTGGSKKRDAEAEPIAPLGIDAPAQAPGFSVNKRASFPPMFVANVGAPGGGCGTTESADLMFPNPGQYVQYAGATPGKNTAPPIHCNNAVAPAAPATPAAPAASAGSAIPPPTIPTPAPAPAGTVPSAVTISGTAVPSMTIVPVPSAAPSVAPAAPAPAPSASAPAAPAAPATGSTGAQTGPCTTEGQFNCIGGTSFQQCASGSWSIVQPVASGTHCTAGLSATLGIYKRSASVRFSSEHLKRHAKKWSA